MTLLILEIKVPHPPHDVPGDGWRLVRSLLDLWPSFLAYVLSFGTVLIMWVNHHGLFRHAHRVNNRLLFTNGLLLLLVTFVPFPTAVLAEYMDRPGANAAATFYCGTYVLVGVSYNLLLGAVLSSRSPGAAASPAHQAAAARARRAYRAGLAVYLAATLVAVFSAFGGLAICFSLWVLWAWLNYSPGHDATAM
jgi:uncharacterized membrane protein